MKIKVTNCHGCPFSSWRLNARRISHKCNIQKDFGFSYKSDLKKDYYDCFKSCPLKKEDVCIGI